MTPERWQHITDLFHRALAIEPGARDAFLRDACRSDPALRAEVDQLLSAHASLGPDALGAASHTAASPVHLEPGTMVGAYRVDAFVGAGGMGEVYRATDTRLRRTVALKILAPAFSTDREFLSWFEREAHLLAALNHPHVGAIHGIEEFEGGRALVLEFVEGPTLAERLSAGRLPLADTVAIARQISGALAAAHDKGIVHRDLKPANIKITPAGDVKVLDFGIATLTQAQDGPASGAAPTLTAPRGSGGAVIGTAAYMSPEQARGEQVDKRTDIWALGCVLYEMLAGRPAFDGKTSFDTIAKVLEREPEWETLPASVPAPLRALVRRCLKKNPAERWHDVADVELELREALEAPDVSRGPVKGSRGRRWALGVAGVVTVAALALWLNALRGRNDADFNPPAAAVEFGIRFPDNHIAASGIAVSPDGRYIAVGVFHHSSHMWLYTVATSDTRPVPGTEGSSQPFWSRDSNTLAFFTPGKLRTMRFPDGQPTSVCDVPGDGLGGTWNGRDEIVFAASGGLFRVSATGGQPSAIPVPAGKSPISPQFLPDDDHLIYTDGGRRGIGGVTLTSLDGREHRVLVDTDAPAVFVAPHHVLFVRGTALMAQVLNLDHLALEGAPALVASNVSHGIPLGLRANVSASATGVLAYARPQGGSVGHLRWFDRAGQAASSIVGSAESEYVNPALSPNGQQLAVNRIDPQTGNWDIWTIELARGVPSRLTHDAAQDTDPVWSPDGTEIVFASDRGGRMGLYRTAVDGSKPEELVLAVDGPTVLVPTDWSRNGYIVYYQGRPGGWINFALPLFGDRKPVRLFGPEFSPYGARVSPDGKWIAYGSFETGPAETYVQRFLSAGQRQQVSRGGGVHPRWTADGRELVYWAVPGGIASVPFESDGSSFRLGPQRTLIQAPVLSLIDARTHYDMTRDGKRFLVRQPAGPQGAGVTVVLNWTEKLRTREK